MKGYLKCLAFLFGMIFSLSSYAASQKCCRSEGTGIGSWVILGIFVVMGSLLLWFKIKSVRQEKNIFKRWEQLANNSTPELQYQMSERYYRKSRTKSALKKREALYQRALKAGNLHAKFQETIEGYFENKVELTETIRQLEEIASFLPIAYYYLGEIYSNYDDNRDIEKAKNYFKKAADSGVGKSYTLLADLLLNVDNWEDEDEGEGSKSPKEISLEDRQLAQEYYKKALNGGDLEVARSLASLYTTEAFGAIDNSLAYMYYQIALFCEQPYVLSEMEKLEKRLTPFEINKATAQAVIWLDDYYKNKTNWLLEEATFSDFH